MKRTKRQRREVVHLRFKEGKHEKENLEESKDDVDPCGKKQRSEEEEGKCKGEISKEKCEILNDKVARRPSKNKGLGYSGDIRNYYTSSRPPIIHPIRKDELFYFSQLALWCYNFKEGANFDNVKVLRAKRSMAKNFYYYITFKAFSPQAVATTFQTKICYYFPKPCSKFDIIFVRIRPSDDSDDFAEISQKDRPLILRMKDKIYKKRLSNLIETQTDVSQLKLPVYLSQFALNDYNILDLHVPAARHDIPSLKIVKPMELCRKKMTYLLTFQASLCDDNKNFETFETKICMPTLFPTTTIEFWNFKIKTN